MIPLWNKNDGVVYAESCMFFGKDPVKLLFPADKILRVKCPVRGTVYQEGIDFLHTPGSDELVLTEDSAIPALPGDAIYPDPATAVIYPAEGANAVNGGPDGKLVLFSAKDFFAQYQVEVDYQTTTGVFPELPHLSSGQLPKFCSKMQAGKPLAVTLIGDSISEGYNATKYLNVPPFQPPYIELFGEELKRLSGAEVTVRNCGVNGTGCEHAFTIEDRWLEVPCDLMVIAYGMNDYARTSPERFRDSVLKIIAKKRAVHPETEFILIASMTGNPEWRYTKPGMELPIINVIQGLSDEHIAVADVCSFWKKLLERKSFFDLTGNGVNHPNDYGHRVYASVLSALF